MSERASERACPCDCVRASGLFWNSRPSKPIRRGFASGGCPYVCIDTDVLKDAGCRTCTCSTAARLPETKWLAEEMTNTWLMDVPDETIDIIWVRWYITCYRSSRGRRIYCRMPLFTQIRRPEPPPTSESRSASPLNICCIHIPSGRSEKSAVLLYSSIVGIWPRAESTSVELGEEDKREGGK